jgi:hypothetical protein
MGEKNRIDVRGIDRKSLPVLQFDFLGALKQATIDKIASSLVLNERFTAGYPGISTDESETDGTLHAQCHSYCLRVLLL